MNIKQIKLEGVPYPAEKLRILSENEDVYVIFRISKADCIKYRVGEHNRYRVRPLKWFIRDFTDEDLEFLATKINLGIVALARF